MGALELAGQVLRMVPLHKTHLGNVSCWITVTKDLIKSRNLYELTELERNKVADEINLLTLCSLPVLFSAPFFSGDD